MGQQRRLVIVSLEVSRFRLRVCVCMSVPPLERSNENGRAAGQFTPESGELFFWRRRKGFRPVKYACWFSRKYAQICRKTGCQCPLMTLMQSNAAYMDRERKSYYEESTST
jgi:hypothetical protein